MAFEIAVDETTVDRDQRTDSSSPAGLVDPENRESRIYSGDTPQARVARLAGTTELKYFVSMA